MLFWTDEKQRKVKLLEKGLRTCLKLMGLKYPKLMNIIYDENYDDSNKLRGNLSLNQTVLGYQSLHEHQYSTDIRESYYKREFKDLEVYFKCITDREMQLLITSLMAKKISQLGAPTFDAERVALLIKISKETSHSVVTDCEQKRLTYFRSKGFLELKRLIIVGGSEKAIH